MINFQNIRGDSLEGQRSFFEQIICHLANLDKGGGICRRIDGSGGDGGVEALRILPSGRKVGYQAKYYSTRDKIDWNKIDNSVKTAFKQHPELERYVIAIACDFTGKRQARGGSTDGVWGTWDSYVKQWEPLASNGIAVEFEPWTAFEIEARLLKPEAEHLIKPFFNRNIFSRVWIQRHLDRTIHDLQARYSPGEHVDTQALMPFDVIYRRDNICQHLQSIFDLARQSNPRSAASLIKNPESYDADIIAVENSLKSFLAKREAVHWPFEQPWPINEWNTSWHTMTRRLSDLTWEISDNIRGEKSSDSDTLRNQLWKMSKVNELIRPEVFAGHWAGLLNIDLLRAVLFVGRAGAGKSHILARGVEDAWNNEAPVIHILGQHILDDDPRVSILNRLEISNWSFHEMLSALNFMAESSATRAMLVIDALNEGRGIEVWQNHLSSFIQEVNKHERVFLVLSCREEYLNYVVPPELITNLQPYPDDNGELSGDCLPLGKLVSVAVDGFSTMQEREAALRKFMDEKGIARPTAPLLDAEFFNPLFMTSVCRSMAKARIKVFPRGLHGTRDLFDFVLATKAKSLGTRFDGQPRIHDALRAALMALAGIMVANKEDKVPFPDALDVVNFAFQAYPLTNRTWLEVLEGSDILRRDVEGEGVGTWSKPNEVIRFSFQRLQDNLIAEWLVNDCQSIDSAFASPGPFSFLLHRSIRKSDGVQLVRPNSRWAGVLGALWAAIAEKHGKELWYLQSFFGSSDVHFYPNEFRKVFHSSIRERSGSAFTRETKVILDRLWEEAPKEKLAILLSTSCVPSHEWNADYIVARFLEMSLPNRDAAWSQWFTHEQSKLVDRAMEITDWALNVDAKRADPEVARLTGIILTCLFAVTHRPLRDKATKGLISLFSKRPDIIPGIVERFGVVDDLYILERICAAVFGAVTRGFEQKALKDATFSIYTSVFASGTPPLNLNLRDYARATIEYASAYDGADERIDIRKCRPPYKSEWPLQDISEEELEALAGQAGGNEILRSSFNSGGDFGTYETTYRVHHFTNVSLKLARPLNDEERKIEFDNQIENWDIEKRIAWLELNAALDERSHLWRMDDKLEDGNGISFSYSRETIEVVERKEQKFIALLNDAEREIYTGLILPVIMPERFNHKVPSIPEFDSQFAKSWVTKRAYEFGWNKELFPKDHSYSDDHYTRNRPTIERIGKKYQWLALSELMARLSDNVWTLGKWPEQAMQYDHPATDWFVRDVEPSILIDINDQQNINHWWQKLALELEPVDPGQLRNWPFSENPPNVPDWLDVISPDGTPWLLLYGLFSNREKRTDSDTATLSLERQIFVRVSTILVKSTEVDSVMKKMKGCRLSDPSGHECLRWTDGPFLCEYPWRNTWNYRASVYEEGSFGRISSGIRYIRPVAEHTWESHLDLSLKDGFSTHLLHPWVGQKMGLVHDVDHPGSLLSRVDNQTVFFDPSIGYSGSSAGLINKANFFEFLRTEGLDCIWIIAGERNSYPSGNHGDYSCRYFASTYRLVNDRWKGNKWHRDEGSGKSNK